MDGDGGMDMVDAEEDSGNFEDKGEALILNFPWVCRRIYWYIFGGKISGA